MTTGERIRKLRKENGFSQNELSELLGIKTITLIGWEKDRCFPQGENLYKLSKIFDVSMNYIFCGEKTYKK